MKSNISSFGKSLILLVTYRVDFGGFVDEYSNMINVVAGVEKWRYLQNLLNHYQVVEATEILVDDFILRDEVEGLVMWIISSCVEIPAWIGPLSCLLVFAGWMSGQKEYNDMLLPHAIDHLFRRMD